MAAQCAVLRNPGLNQVPLHARQQGLAVVQRQAERIEGRIVTRHSIPAPGLPGAEVSTPMFGTVSSAKSVRIVHSGPVVERRLQTQESDDRAAVKLTGMTQGGQRRNCPYFEVILEPALATGRRDKKPGVDES